MDINNQLNQLYTQKGKIITNLEMLQASLRNINEKIVELKNAAMIQPPVKIKDIDKSEKES